VKTAASVAAVVCHVEPLRKFALAARLGLAVRVAGRVARLLVSLDQISETVELRHSGRCLQAKNSTVSHTAMSAMTMIMAIHTSRL
jgi:hypothetical protein